jgi:hypothetical protein
LSRVFDVTWVQSETLQRCFSDIFEALALTSDTAPAMLKLSIKNAARDTVIRHPDHVSDPTKASVKQYRLKRIHSRAATNFCMWYFVPPFQVQHAHQTTGMKRFHELYVPTI